MEEGLDLKAVVTLHVYVVPLSPPYLYFSCYDLSISSYHLFVWVAC